MKAHNEKSVSDLPIAEASSVFWRFFGAILVDQSKLHNLVFIAVFLFVGGAVFYLFKWDVIAGVTTGLLCWLLINIPRYKLLLRYMEHNQKQAYKHKKNQAVQNIEQSEESAPTDQKRKQEKEQEKPLPPVNRPSRRAARREQSKLAQPKLQRPSRPKSLQD